MVDTVSSLFAILDGSTDVAAKAGILRLSAQASDEQLNGNLQERFLALVEQYYSGQ